MLTERSRLAFVGICLVAAGVAWENFFGPSLVGWGAIISGHLALAGGTRRGSWRTALDWQMVLLVLAAGIAVWATSNVDATLLQITRLLSSIAGYYGLVRWSRGHDSLVQTSLMLIVAGLVLALAAPFLVDWDEAKGIPIPQSIYDFFPSLAADAVHPNIMATLLVLLFPISFVYVFVGNNRCGSGFPYRKLMAIIACGLMSLVLLLTKSRGGYFAGTIGMILVVGYYKRRVALLLTGTAMIVFAILLIFRDGSQQASVASVILDSSTWEFRKEVWRIAVWMMADFPFTGVGMGTFSEVASRLYPFSSLDNPGAHNLILQVGVDLGLLGMIAFISIVLSTLWLGINLVVDAATNLHPEIRALAVGASVGLLCFLLHGLVDNAAWGSRASFLPWLLVGLIHALQAYQRDSTELDVTKPRLTDNNAA